MSEYKIYPGRQIFPVQTQTGCMLKWNWSSLMLNNGTTSSCHRCTRYPIDPDNFENFHNVPEKIAARKKMLQGEWPGQGCEYCRDIEQAGGQSDRLMQLERMHGLDKIPPELLEDPTTTEVTPTTLEVWFNNTCNMTCLYCKPDYSSKWANEIKKFGPINIDSFSINNNVVKNPHYEKMVEQLWKYLENNNRSSIIRHFQILGGEPLLQKEFDQCIEFWKQHPNPSLTINVITNLMIPHQAFVEKMQKFQDLHADNSIFMLQLTASLDGWGVEEEHTRFGLDLDLWERNFTYLLDKSWCTLGINSCISSLSVKNIGALVEKINQWNLLSENRIDWSFELPIGLDDSGLHPEVFGPEFFKKDFQKIIDAMPVVTEVEKQSQQHMIGLANRLICSTSQPHKIQNLLSYLSQIDQRRDTDWRKIYTWLDQFQLQNQT
jgi:hypothetical protein